MNIALGFLEQFIEKVSDRGLILRHRADAQALVWAIYQNRVAGTTEDGCSELPPQPPLPPQPEYSIENIIDDGCFLDRVLLGKMLSQLKIKKNLILQGPPGTGKTWLAKRLAYSVGPASKTIEECGQFQFHPNMSYEDFVRGWRPGSDGPVSHRRPISATCTISSTFTG